jgi:nitroreductase
MTKDIIEAIEERSSTRQFTSDEIPDATIGRLLEAARRAPSAGNIQPWYFVVVKNQELRTELTKLAHNQNFVGQAPVVIVICADPTLSEQRYGSRGRDLYCLQDTAAATQNILLAATGYGLGSCWVGAFDEVGVQRVLGLDANKRPVAMIALGHPAEEPSPDPLRSMNEVVRILH